MRRHVLLFLKSLALAGGFFLLLELVLAAAGIGGLDRVRGVSGFDPDAAYLVPSEDVPGEWIPRFDQKGGSNEPVPPRGESARWVLVGASTAASWGSRSLAAYAEDAGLGAVEVVNLGRSGFCSGRVIHVMSQALEHLDPDLILVYGGDNEFLEQPPELREGAAVQRGGRLVRLARRSRVFNTMLRLARSGDVRDAGRPEEFVPMEARLRARVDLDWNRERLEMLRENLRAMCRRAREADVRLVLSTLVYNRFSAPREDGPGRDHPPRNRRRFAEIRARVSELMPTPLAPLLPEGRNSFLTASDWGSQRKGGRAGEDRARVLPGLRPYVGLLAGLPRDVEGLDDWKDPVLEVHTALEYLFFADLDPRGREVLEELEALLTEALELRPSDPRSTFELGLVLQRLGREPARVAALLDRAADLDRVPRKSSPTINAILRDVAAEFPEVLLFDADALAVSVSPDGLVGWEVMMDHCHMHAQFLDLLRRELVAAVARRWPR